MSSVFFSGRVGGTDGTYFQHHRGTDGVLVRSIRVLAGPSSIMRIIVTFTDNSSRTYGQYNSTGIFQPNPQERTFTFNNGERIRTLSLWGNGIGTRLGAIRFTTDHNRTFQHQMLSWSLRTEYPRTVSSGIFVGVWGRSGWEIDALGFIFLQPISSCTLTSLTYPSLSFSGNSLTSIRELEAQSKTVTLQNIFEDNQNLRGEVKEEIEFRDVFSRWAVTNFSQVDLLQFWNTSNISVESARIPLLSISGSQVGWSISSSANNFNSLSPANTTSKHPWANSFFLLPGQKKETSARPYLGALSGLPFTARLRFRTTNGGSFLVTTTIAGTYSGRTYTLVTSSRTAA